MSGAAPAPEARRDRVSAPAMAGPTRPDVTRRAAVLHGVRVHHGAQWRDVARRQADVARRAADDFEAAGDPGMAAMLRGHAEHLTHAATLPVVRRRPAEATA